jgi:hypothetical protein
MRKQEEIRKGRKIKKEIGKLSVDSNEKAVIQRNINSEGSIRNSTISIRSSPASFHVDCTQNRTAGEVVRSTRRFAEVC